MKHLLKKYTPLLFYVLIIIFLIVYLRHIDFHKFKDIDISWTYMVTAIIVGLASLYWAVLTWLVILKSLGASHLKRHIHELTYVFAKSWMGRYIPGTAPWILGKIYFAGRLGVSREKLAVSSILEGALQITISMITGLAFIFASGKLSLVNRDIKLLTVFALILCVIAIFPPIFNRLVSIGYKLIRKKVLPAEHRANTTTIINGSLVYFVAAIISGLAFFFVAKAIYPSLEYNNVLFLIGAVNLGGAVGMLAIFVPSGIGVRDGIFLAFFSLIMPTEIALVVTVVSRLWSLVVDILFFISSKLIKLSTNFPQSIFRPNE